MTWMKSFRGGQLKLLSREQIMDIHNATLEVLEQTGVNVKSEKALRVLEEAGADVNLKQQIAKIPPHLVEEAIRKNPPRFTLHGRNLQKKCKFEDGRVYFSVSGAPPYVLDLDGTRRRATYKDIENLIRITDALEYIHISGAILPGAVEEIGVPEPVAMARRFLLRLKNTDKPGLATDAFVFAANDAIRLQAAVIGGIEQLRRKPIGWMWSNPVAPLMHSKEQTDSVVVYAEQGLPILFASEVMGGVSGPATLGGILVQQNAEVLSGLTIAQMAASPQRRPPVLYGCVSHVVDMRSGVCALGSPESGLLNAASAQLARYYGMASRGTGGTTDAVIPDIQAGYESAMGALMCALAGINFVFNASGGVEPGVLAISYEKQVTDNDMLGMVTRILEGITIDDDTLAVDEIHEIAPLAWRGESNYLYSKHTSAYFRTEHFFPPILSREMFENWKKAGGRSLRKVARERAKQILAEHEPEPLDSDIEKAVQEIVRDIEQRELKS